MKKTDILIKVMTGLVLCAMVAYLSVYMVRRMVNPVQTALAVTATMSDSSTMNGLVLRDELVIQSGEQYIDVVVDDGEKVSAGQTVALAYSSETALARATDLETLAEEIRQVEDSLENSESVSTTVNREESVYSAITDLSKTVRSGELAGVDSQQSTLADLVFRTEKSTATEDYLSQLRADYEELAATAVGDVMEITVGQSGTFSTVVDGYEGVNLQYAKTLSPSTLREVIAANRVVEEEAIGKLITTYDWYYAAILNAEDAEDLVAGRTVELSFGRYYGKNITAEVVYVGRAEGREQLVIFSLYRGFADMLAVRSVSAEIIYSDYTGLRVPLKALYRYYAGYVSEEDAKRLSEGDSVTLSLGERDYEAFVSEIGSAYAYGDLPAGVESGSEEDTRPKRCQVVFCWNWDGDESPDFSAGGGTVVLPGEESAVAVSNYYDYDPETDRMCVFTMTGLQAERKKVSLIYAGEEYCLVSSEGEDALREGNEVIAQARGLYNGKVFQ